MLPPPFFNFLKSKQMATTSLGVAKVVFESIPQHNPTPFDKSKLQSPTMTLGMES